MVFIAGFLNSALAQENQIKQFELDNGMRVILKENHSSPMTTSLIFVNAGSKFETEYNNGVTHFLEHLLFDGTASQSQEALSGGIERLSGYINAFTDKAFTCYLVLMPKDYIDYGMATQADMLFNSNFPEDRFPKERGIIIDEMKMNDDAEGAPAEDYFTERNLAGTPYALRVIGYPSTIANIPRETVIDYWKKFYGPNNMTLLIIGDFDTPRMTETVTSIFGKFPKVPLPSAPTMEYKRLSGKQIFKAAAKTKSTYIDISIEAPQFNDSDYFAMTLLQDYLSDEENSPLVKILKSDIAPLATSISANLDTREEFSRLNIEIVTEKADKADFIISLVDRILDSLKSNLPSEELLDGYKISRRCRDIYMSEKLHHYAFTIAPLLAITGWNFFEKLPERIDSVKISDMERAIKNYLEVPSYIATVVSPQTQGNESVYKSEEPSADEIVAYYRSVKSPSYDLNSGKNFKMPVVKEISAPETKYAKYLKETFSNGLTVVIKSNPDSRVFALNVIGRNRSATEPEGKDGITDFMNHLLEKGTVTRPAEKLAGEQASIGANVTLYDNPWITYDDRYTTRQFSFLKFETIDEFTEKGIELFADIVAHPAFDSVEVEKVRGEIRGRLGRNTGSTYKTAHNLYYAALFQGTPYSKTIEGNLATVGGITIADLKDYYHKIYSPENMIITVGTSQNPEKIMALIKNSLGQIPKTGFVPVEPIRPANISGVKAAYQNMEKTQTYIYMGNLLPSVASPDAPALNVAAYILSKRLQNNLRETQGLTYSVGASITFDKHFGWFFCTIGTDTSNFVKARDGIIAEIEKLKARMPTDDEITEAINSIWGSDLMAKLSRINQAFYMGVNEYLGVGYDYDDVYIDKIRRVDKGMVIKVARRYFDSKNYVIATAGKI
ncbi:MAG: pitrilysin family protein [candidate division Zixibacteria bacterium]|nr:pitrilysin family protein [candidate division Zixibacteria bacterium]